MKEDQLQRVERELINADAKAAAAVAFAAISRIGELGRDAGEAFATLAEGADTDPDLESNWIEGCAQIEDHLA